MRRLTIALMVLLLAGCKEYIAPELPTSTTPLFTFEAEVHNSMIELAADGSHQAYSEVNEDSLGVTEYTGWLASCASCPPRFHFSWRASDLNNPDLIATTSSAMPAIRYARSEDSTITYLISLSARIHAPVASYQWTILGENYTDTTVEVSVKHDEARTHFPVQLDVTYADGCSASMIDTVYLPHHGCDCRIAITQQDSLLFNYEALASGGATYTYEWRFESGEVIPSRELTYQYPQLPADGVEEIEVTINTGDCAATRKKQQYFPDAATGCAANFDYSIERRTEWTASGAGLDLGEVSMTYVDENGNSFVSYLARQNAESYFEVDEVEEYRDPFRDAASASIKVEARFSALFTDGSDTIRISDGRFVLPIGLGAL